jgi:stage IV sporulation protein FB
MRDPLSWSFPIGRVFGISVRIHLLFLFFMVGMVGRGAMATPSYALEALYLQIILFGSVLLHEFGHCFAARQVDGDASEVLLWPLGGLAYVDVPNTPRANLITVIGGPAVNMILCVIATCLLAAYGLMPPLPLISDWDPISAGKLGTWWFSTAGGDPDFIGRFAARLFYVNWIQFWFNMLLVGFPLDGGRILQCILWPHVGFHRATRAAIFSGWIVAILLALVVVIFFPKDGKEAVVDGGNLLMLFFLALFIFHACKQEFILLETGRLNEDAVFGYDFSQGYTSLEKDQAAAAPPKRAKPSFWQRWLKRRADRKRQRDEQERILEETRVDELLAKVQSSGIQSLSDEEQRFLKRVSAKIRHRNQ